MSDKCYPGVPMPPCPPQPGRPCPPPPPFKPLPGCTQQYIGARYVPVFADPIEWDINKPYESLTIVTYQGSSYTSRCAVPGGTDITNTRYWAKTGDYNAQIAQYQEEVKDLSTQVTGFAKDNAEFREKIDQYDKDNAAMKNEVAAATARVDDLAKRVDQAEADIDSLQATTNQHTQKLADLEAADTKLAQSIADNDTDIANLQKKDIQHDSEIAAIKTVNDQQGAAIAQNTADIAQNKKNIADNAANIAENAAEIAKHAEILKDHTADLAALHRDVQDNKEGIAKNASDIVGLRADLTEAEADIAQNKDGIAHLKADVVRIDEKNTQQDNIIGTWTTDHPSLTISECVASIENTLEEQALRINELEQKAKLIPLIIRDNTITFSVNGFQPAMKTEGTGSSTITTYRVYIPHVEFEDKTLTLVKPNGIAFRKMSDATVEHRTVTSMDLRPNIYNTGLDCVEFVLNSSVIFENGESYNVEIEESPNSYNSLYVRFAVTE